MPAKLKLNTEERLAIVEAALQQLNSDVTALRGQVETLGRSISRVLAAFEFALSGK